MDMLGKECVPLWCSAELCPKSMSKPISTCTANLIPWLSRSSKEREGGAHHLHTFLLAASPRNLVSEDTKSCRVAFSLLETEIPESLCGREVALRQAQRKQH